MAKGGALTDGVRKNRIVPPATHVARKMAQLVSSAAQAHPIRKGNCKSEGSR